MSNRNGPEPDAHISTAMLMLHLDGELSEAQAAAVAKHLHQCWACRERVEWLNRGVFTFLEYHRNVLVAELPAVEPRPGALRMFLEEALRPAEAPKIRALWDRIVQTTAKVSVAAWVTAATSLVFFIALSYLSVVRPASLTASEFLERVCQRSTTITNTRHLPVNRRVQIRRGKQVFEHYIPAAGTRAAAVDQPDPETLAALKLARVDWSDPLNPSNLASWHRSVPNPRDVIRESATSVTLETTLTADGPVRFVSFTVSREDWWPKSQHIEFRGQPMIDISELPPEPLEPPAVLRVMRHTAPAVVAEEREASGPTAEQLDDSEVRLREVLHGLQADRYAAPVISREPGEITLLAFAPSPEQRDEIHDAVHDIPYVSERLVTTEPVRLATDSGTPHATQTVRAPLADNLRRYCGGLAEANSYLAALAESHSETLMAASALQSLANRYSAAGWDRLSPDLQARLTRLVDDYVTRLQRSARFYDALASPVLDAMMRETGVRESAEKRSLAGRYLSWREEPAAMAERVQRMQSILTRLFAEVEARRADEEPPCSVLLIECSQARAELKQLLYANDEKRGPADQAP